MLVVMVFSIDVSLALEMEKKRQDLTPLQSGEIKDWGKKGGGGTPTPPADPYCPNGSAGPVEHSTINRECEVNGKKGMKTCYHKMVACIGGAGEPDYAHSENCGPCVALPTQPGQTTTPTGQ